MLINGANRKVLVIISPSVNYFYGVIGNRIARSLSLLNFDVVVSTLREAPDQPNEWLILVNISEIALGHGDLPDALRRIHALKTRSRRAGVVVLDCVATNWFAENYRLCREVEIDMLIDMGFHDQHQAAPEQTRAVYHFLFNGLMQSERQLVQQHRRSTTARPIPWAFIGHAAGERVRLVEQLMTSGLGSHGFVYLPRLMAYSADGPHLNGQQLHSVLAQTRYYIWCSHHKHFYMESERFRDAALAGTIPIKVIASPFNQKLLFSQLMLNEQSFADQILSFDFAELRGRFIDQYCALPSLEQSLSDFIEQQG
jgi:hypothetical protein